MNFKKEIEKEALALGFSAFGVTSADYDPISHDKFKRWINRGYQAGMKYLERGIRQRFDPRIHLPSAKSVIVCAHNHYSEPKTIAGRPYISLYARGEDYHRVIGDKLRILGDKLRAISEKVALIAFVDSGAISEKSLAVMAGLGFIGRNGLLILHKRGHSGDGGPRGSFHFLGVIITDLILEPDTPLAGTCGKCRRCIDACPTGAIVSDGELDARLCISYHTTQSKVDIPRSVASAMGDIIYGCDICQIVCPYNSASWSTIEPRLKPIPDLANFDFPRLLNMTEEEYRSLFARSVIGELGFGLFGRNLRAVVSSKNLK